MTVCSLTAGMYPVTLLLLRLLLLLHACVRLFVQLAVCACPLSAFSCYSQEAAFRMANGFPDSTPRLHTHTHTALQGDNRRSPKGA